MREITSTVYQFDELSERAKDTARDWMRDCNGQDTDWAECVIEDAARLADIIGINLRQRPVRLMGGGTRQDPDVYWAVADRDSGASYAGSYTYKAQSVKRLAAEAPVEYDGKVQAANAEINRICRELADVQRRNFYQVQATIGHGRRRSAHSSGMEIDVDRADDKELSEADADATVQALKDFADWLHSQLEREWEYRMSDETIDEDIRANEYEFDEDGNRA